MPARAAQSTPRQPGPARVLGCPPSLPGLTFSQDELAVLIGELLLHKIDTDAAGDEPPACAAEPPAVAAWWARRARASLEACCLGFFLARCGGRLVAEAHCSALALGVVKAAARSARAHLFGRCLGLLEPAAPPAGVGALLHFLALLHGAAGPLTGEATDGASQVLARTAAQAAMEVLQPTAAPVCADVAGLPAALAAAAGGGSDGCVDLDEASALVLAAWAAQRAADQRHLEALAAAHAAGCGAAGCGLTNADDVAALLRHLVPALAGPVLTQEQSNSLFLSALHASGPRALGGSAAGVAAAVLDAGLLGAGAHLRRHPAIAHRPPFSELRLLQASWRAVKPALREVQRFLPASSGSRAPPSSSGGASSAPPGAVDLGSMAARLDHLLDPEAVAAPAEAWALFRRTMGVYAAAGGSFPEAAASTPATPRDGGSSLLGTPRRPAGSG